MKQSCPLGQSHIHTQLRRHQAGDVGNLDGVVQHVLTVGSTVLLTAQNLHQLRVQVMHIGLVAGPLALLPDGAVHFLPGLFHHVLDAGGVDSAVYNQLFQGQTGNLPAHRVKAGDGNGLGGIVDNQIHTGDGFQGADVPAFPADDSALHLVVGQGHHGHGGFSHMVGGAALDGGGENLSCLVVRLVLQLLLDFLDLHGSFVANLGLHAVQQKLLGLLLGEARNLLQLFQVLGFDFLHLLPGLGHICQAACQLGLFPLKSVGLLVQGFFLLLQAALLLAQLGTALLHFFFVLGTGSMNFVLGFQQHFLFPALTAADGFVDDPGGLLLRRDDFPLTYPLAVVGSCEKAQNAYQKNANDGENNFQRSHNFCTPPFCNRYPEVGNRAT